MCFQFCYMYRFKSNKTDRTEICNYANFENASNCIFLYENTNLSLPRLQCIFFFLRYEAKRVFRKLWVFGPNASNLTYFYKYQRQKR